jgi:hypothetical protein
MRICSSAPGSSSRVGWLPILLQQSGNAKIACGTAGNFVAALLVQRLDVPARLDRSEGDIHPGGNPHIQTDPRNIGVVADALAKRLASSIRRMRRPISRVTRTSRALERRDREVGAA